MSIFIRIPKQEITVSGNRCIVHKRDTGQLIGAFGPNEMLIHADGPYDAIPHKTRFRPEGATLGDWRQFKLQMRALNGRIVTDDFIPSYLHEEMVFLRVG